MTLFISKNEQETLNYAAEIAKRLKTGDIVALHGTLGTGKTVFSKGIIQALCAPDIDVPSPTFTIVQAYDSIKGPIYHFDFYRLKNPQEAFEIGIEDAFIDGICLIEWPDKIGNLLPKNRIDIYFDIQDQNHTIQVKTNSK